MMNGQYVALKLNLEGEKTGLCCMSFCKFGEKSVICKIILVSDFFVIFFA